MDQRYHNIAAEMYSPPPSRRVYFIAIVALIILLKPPIVWAEIAGADSVEYMTKTAEVVVRAQHPDLIRTIEQGNDTRQIWRVTVVEKLKGSAPLELLIAHWPSRSEMREWQQSGGERVLFLATSELYGSHVRDAPAGTLLPREREWMLPTPHYRSKRQIFGYTRDFRAVPDLRSLCETVRQSVQVTPNTTAVSPSIRSIWLFSWPRIRNDNGVSLDAPMHSDIFGDLYGGSAVLLIVPLDAETELLAQQWFFDPRLRSNALCVLVHFKSDQNAQLIAEFLSDPRYSWQGSARAAKWTYEIRLVAYETLRHWRNVVRRPPLFGPDDFYQSAGPPLMLLAVMASFAACARPRRRSLGRFAVLFVCTILACVAIAAAIALALWREHVFEFTFKLGNARHWVATPYGQVVWITVEQWNDGNDARFALFRRFDGVVDDLWKPVSYLVDSAWRWRRFDVIRARQPWGDESQSRLLPYTRIAAPLWSVCALACGPVMALAVVSLRRWRRSSCRARRGLCQNCGYDMRITPSRCPECGVVVRSLVVRVAKRDNYAVSV